MRKKIRQLMKRSLAGFVALALAFGCLPAAGIPVRAAEAEPVSVSNFTSHIPGQIVLENTGGDNLVLLQPLSAEDEFVFGADVTFTNLDEQQSAALIFGIRDNALDDSHAIKANIHAKIDWNVPARVWGYGTDELRCPGETGYANTYFAENSIDVTQTFRMEVSVQKNSENKYVLTYSLTNTNGEKVTVAQGILNDSYAGGRFGLMTYSSRAVFSNITVDGQKYGALEGTEAGLAIHGVNGDAHIVSNVKLESEQGFTYETDIDLAADTCSAALTFGIQNPENPGEAWIGANFNFNDNNGAGGARVFQVQNGSADIGSASLEGKLDKYGTIHVKLHVSSEGIVTYELYNTDNPENKVTITGTLTGYQGGYLGLLTFDSSAVFTNTAYALDEAVPAANYNTNLGELTYAGGSGTWAFTENGLYSDATGKGDCFAFSQVTGTNFVYSTDIDFDGTEGAAALVFRSNQDLNNKECYAVNIDVGSHKCKFWRWQENNALQLIDEKEVPAATDEKYTLKVVAYDSWILYYVNDLLVASLGDYVLQPGNLGQNTVIKEGCFGILNWNSKVTFQNTYYKELSGEFNPILTDISVTSSVGTVEAKTQFTPTEPITLQYVKNDASTVNIEVVSASAAAVVEVRDANGTVYADGRNIPVNEGSNYITVTSTVTAEDGTTATATYRVNVHRFKADAVYYNEAYRNQYHYSVKEGWANDPNGLVYFNGTYHFFYQFYDDIIWGPMHWAHATSTDLIHWEEQPIALYPDANGAMFSGCMVIDADNTTGFFDGIPGGGLVALITADGNGQRIKLAYSTDEGKTWTKVDEIAADWTDDPLQDAAFRDPKVFRWEGKWFMVVAGGPLRIYSSDNLRQWKCEATYADLHTECPDLYPIQAPDGQIKWVLSRGGRFYKIGDFKTVDGNWRFVPDADYVRSDGVMNFGRDFYAAMTYYVQDFGTAADPTLPELVELNWMNTWDDYCNLVAEKVGQDFNGTFNLNLKLGLKKDGDKYVLTQTPISGYESLRDTANKQEWTQVTVEANNTLLKDFVGDTYEIIAKFYPEEGTTKVGFKVRTGEGEETRIVYDLDTQTMSIDRSSSGIIISGKFAETTSQNVTVNPDGTVDMHIYVDKSSVEAFAMDHTVAGSVQIFPSPLSVGAQVLVEGNPAKADITIYPLSSIWTDKAEMTEPQYIGSTLDASQNMYTGDTLKLSAYVLPTNVSQEFTWTVTEGSDVAAVDASGTVTALKKGTAVIVAASKANPALTREFTILVTENNFNTNLSGFVNVNGNWHIDDETLSVSNGGQNDYYMSAEMIEGDFTLETDICYTNGLINLFLASEGQNPHVGVGAYTIQFGYGTNVRLFPFGNDDFATGTMESPINDGEYHHVKVVREGQTVTVYVDDAKCLEHTFEETEAFFANGHVGIGLWDGALDVRNFLVYPLEDPADPEVLNGIVGDYYYIDGVQQKAYQLFEYEGSYYFLNDGDKIAKSTKLYLSEKFLVGKTLSDGSAFPAGLYYFDEQGRITNPPEVIDTTLNGIIDDYYYIDGVQQKAYQLFEYEGSYYFLNDGDKIAKDTKLYLSEAFVAGVTLSDGSAFPAGLYTFGADGKITNPPAVIDKSINGIIDDYYYIDGIKQKACLLFEIDGDFYFLNDGDKIAKNTKLYLSEAFVAGVTLSDGSAFPAGLYTFGADGKITNPPAVIDTTLNGIIGDYYYIDGVQQKAYQLFEYEGSYYFLNDGDKIAKDTKLYLSEAFVAGVTLSDGSAFPAGLYTFGADGKITNPPAVIDKSMNGIIGDYYYIDGVQQKAYQLFEYEGSYYFLNDGDKIAKDTKLYLSEKFVTGVTLPDGSAFPAGLYTFGADGKITNLPG